VSTTNIIHKFKGIADLLIKEDSPSRGARHGDDRMSHEIEPEEVALAKVGLHKVKTVRCKLIRMID
jgi:hypothetical protein